jgi:uncharacterized protein (TIGR02145 family)
MKLSEDQKIDFASLSFSDNGQQAGEDFWYPERKGNFQNYYKYSNGTVANTPVPNPCVESIAYDGYEYSVKLMPDGKCWTTTNMKHLPVKYIPWDSQTNQSGPFYVGNSWNYGDSEANLPTNGTGAVSGRLYSWYAAMGLDEGSAETVESSNRTAFSICSALGSGWKLPTEDQWRDLEKAGGTKEIVTSYPGYQDYTGMFRDYGKEKNSWAAWSSTSKGSEAYFYANFQGNQYLGYGDIGKKQGASVVCIKN